jgi:opacity protein-like surface antigen
MRTKLGIMALVAAIGVTGMGFAAPMTNFEKGKVAIDFDYSMNTEWSGSAEANGIPASAVKSVSTSAFPTISGVDAWNAAATVGVNNKIAIKAGYNKQNLGSVHFSSGDEESPKSTNIGLDEQIFNADVLYKYNKNVTPYIGWGHGKLKADISGSAIPAGLIAKDNVTNNFIKVGFIAQAPITEKVTAWTDLAIGTKSYQKMELGLGYQFSQNLDFNVGYRYQQLKYEANFNEFTPSGVDVPGNAELKMKTKGWFVGATYKI